MIHDFQQFGNVYNMYLSRLSDLMTCCDPPIFHKENNQHIKSMYCLVVQQVYRQMQRERQNTYQMGIYLPDFAVSGICGKQVRGHSWLRRS